MPILPLYRHLAAVTLSAIAAAQSLTGVVVDAIGNPVAGVTIALSNAGGNQVTDLLGAFNFPVLQNRTYTVSVLPPTSQWAPRQLSFRVQGASNMGNVVVQNGARLFGLVLGPAGAPLPNANLDALDTGGTTLYTPGDSTDAAGLFSVTVPLGQTLIRMNPPAGQTLIRFETNLLITGDLDLGILHLPQAFNVTGSVVDSVTSFPISAVRVSTFDNITGTEVLQSSPTSNSLGSFTLQLPIGVHRLEFDPPTGNQHAARVKHSVLVLGATSLGIIGLQPGITLTGTVTGPGGPVANCDIDVQTVDGQKLFTLHDNTTANGTFTVVVPPGTYRVRVDPLVSTGLYGTRTAPQVFAASGPIAPIALQPGVALQLGVIGPLGFEGNADLDFFEPLTGEPIIIVGDKSDAGGIINAVVPTGLFDIALDAAQGSTAAPFRIQAAVPGPVALPLFLGQKQAVLDFKPSFGIQSIPQNGTLFLDARFRNLLATTLPSSLEVAIRFPSGQEQFVAALPFDMPPGFDFGLGQFQLPMPAVPVTGFGKDLRLYLRLRDGGQQVIDQAYVEFVVE